MAHLVDTDTGDRCALLMSRGATRAQRLGGVLRDSRLLSDPRADGDAGSAMQDMIAQLSEGAGKDAFWGDAAAPRSRPAAAALDNPRLAAFALRDANAHLAREHAEHANHSGACAATARPPEAPRPMPHAPRPMPNAQCPTLRAGLRVPRAQLLHGDRM